MFDQVLGTQSTEDFKGQSQNIERRLETLSVDDTKLVQSNNIMQCQGYLELQPVKLWTFVLQSWE